MVTVRRTNESKHTKLKTHYKPEDVEQFLFLESWEMKQAIPISWKYSCLTKITGFFFALILKTYKHRWSEQYKRH